MLNVQFESQIRIFWYYVISSNHYVSTSLAKSERSRKLLNDG
jgi:hypothetical protein